MYFHAVDALHLPSGKVVNDQTMQAACRALGVATWRKQRNSRSPLIACPLHQRRKFDHQKHRLSWKRNNTNSRTIAERGGPKSVSELQREIACSTGTQKGTMKRVVQNECWRHEDRRSWSVRNPNDVETPGQRFLVVVAKTLE